MKDDSPDLNEIAQFFCYNNKIFKLSQTLRLIGGIQDFAIQANFIPFSFMDILRRRRCKIPGFTIKMFKIEQFNERKRSFVGYIYIFFTVLEIMSNGKVCTNQS